MRDIFFRGKSIKTGEWVEGWFVPGNERKSLNPSIFVYLLETQSFDCIDVDIESVGQFIGLTDKNDQMIFEGDVIKHKDELYCVKWFVDGLNAAYYPFVTFDDGFCVYSEDCEIIGNIYDSPELKEKCR